MPNLKIFDEYATEAELAQQIGRSIRTLRLWRQKRIGPPWTEMGRRVLYHHAAIPLWLKSLEHNPVRARRRAA